MARTKGFKKDTRVWDSMKRNLNKNRASINIGWFEGQNYGSDNNHLPMAQVAQWVEEGHWNGGMFSGTYTPPRPAIRTLFIPTLAQSRDLLDHSIPLIHQVAIGRMNWKKLHMKIAPKLLHLFQYTLRSYNVIPNSPVTVSLKGFNDPWRETGALIDNARFEVAGYKLYPSKAYKG